MFVTLLGLVTNLGIGSMQVASGLEYLFGMDHSKTNLLIVILVMATVATAAAVSGVEKRHPPPAQPEHRSVQRPADLCATGRRHPAPAQRFRSERR